MSKNKKTITERMKELPNGGSIPLTHDDRYNFAKSSFDEEKSFAQKMRESKFFIVALFF